MKRNSIRWRLPVSYAAIALLAALSLGSVMLLVLRNYYASQEREYLYGNAVALQPVLEQLLQSDLPAGALQDQINGLGFLSQARIHVLDADGNTLADSGVPDPDQVVAVSGAPIAGMMMFTVPVDPPEGQEPTLIYTPGQSDSPDVVPFEEALPASQADIILPVRASPYGYGFVQNADFDPTRRSSQTVSLSLTALDAKPLGVLEFSGGPSYGSDVIESVTRAWLVAGVFAIMIAALAGWFVSKQVTRPVLALEHATRQMEQGNLSVRVDLHNEKQYEFLSLADSFNGMAKQVEQTVSTLREFVADAAHELHTPLTALQANLELARDETNASERVRYLSRAQEQSRRLEALVHSLLDLSRIEAAQPKSDYVPVDLVQLVRQVGEMFASRAEQAERSFMMNIPNDGIQIMGNEMQWKQVTLNLLENALKFTPPGGWISLNLEHSSGRAILTVTDSGIGIPPEDLPHLFERFHRGRNASEYPGNGLGLAIVKAIVGAHMGNVEVRSEDMQGTSITVSLPVQS